MKEADEEGELIKIWSDFLDMINEYHYKKRKLYDC